MILKNVGVKTDSLQYISYQMLKRLLGTHSSVPVKYEEISLHEVPEPEHLHQVNQKTAYK